MIDRNIEDVCCIDCGQPGELQGWISGTTYATPVVEMVCDRCWCKRELALFPDVPPKRWSVRRVEGEWAVINRRDVEIFRSSVWEACWFLALAMATSPDQRREFLLAPWGSL